MHFHMLMPASDRFQSPSFNKPVGQLEVRDQSIHRSAELQRINQQQFWQSIDRFTHESSENNVKLFLVLEYFVLLWRSWEKNLFEDFSFVFRKLFVRSRFLTFRWPKKNNLQMNGRWNHQLQPLNVLNDGRIHRGLQRSGQLAGEPSHTSYLLASSRWHRYS